MKRAMFNYSLRAILTAGAVTLAVAITAGLAAITESVATSQLERQIGDSLAQRTVELADKIDREMFERYQDIALFRDLMTDLDLLERPAAMRARLNALRASYVGYAWIGYLDLNGNVLAATDGLLEGSDISQHPWFKEASKAAFVGDVHPAAMPGKKLNSSGSQPLRLLDVAMPVRNKNNVLTGVLCAHLDWRWIEEITRSLPHSGQSEFLLLGAHNSVILGPKDLQGRSVSTGSVLQAKKGNAGYRIERWPDGKIYLIGYSQSHGYRNYPGLGWAILERQEIGRAFAPVMALRQQFINWGVVIAGIFALFGWFAAARISRPLIAITRAAESLQRGSPVSKIPFIEDYREVAVLARTLRSMISELTHREAQLEHQATHNSLTQLPNRALIKALLRQIISKIDGGRQIAVLTLDVDRFKTVNDTLSYAGGDAVLQAVAERLRSCMGVGGVLGHLGRDEFVIVQEESAMTLWQSMALAVRARDAIAKPFLIEDVEFFLPASIGISLFPKDGKDAETLLGYSEVAVYQAKAHGGNRIQFYEAQMNAAALERLELERDLHHALEQHQFELHYQPQISLKTGAIVGVEALVRWRHPERGLISPAKFIPVAEASGLIVPLGDWVMSEACAQAQAWREEGLPPIRIGVNVSVHQFNEGKLVQKVSAVLAQSGFQPEWLKLELTESLLMQEVERSIETMRELTGLGVRLAVDDFGTGYSSLSYLKRFPISELKIDQSFVRDLGGPSGRKSEDAAIVRTIISLGHNLKLSVIAEGVETAEQARFLRQAGCNEMQGYYFSQPILAHRLAALMRTQVQAIEEPMMEMIASAPLLSESFSEILLEAR